MWRRILFLAVGTLVLWYLGHFAANALLLALAPEISATTARLLDLVVLSFAAVLAWWVMRHLTPGDTRPPTD